MNIIFALFEMVDEIYPSRLNIIIINATFARTKVDCVSIMTYYISIQNTEISEGDVSENIFVLNFATLCFFFVCVCFFISSLLSFYIDNIVTLD